MSRAAILPAAAVILAALGSSASAQPEETFEPRYVLETGRIQPRPPDENRLNFSVHGEYQLRYRALTDFRLEPPIGQPDQTTLGQNQYLYHWLRLKPRLDYRDEVSVVGEIDLPRGLVVGDATQFVTADREPLDEERWYDVRPRQLYVAYQSPIGMFRVGMQSSHWGMGILANDGDHPSMFGDYDRGSIVHRFLFATTPSGKGTPVFIALAGDIVHEDNTAELVEGDRAFQGVGALGYRTDAGEIGVYGVLRHQNHSRDATGAFTPFTEDLTVGVIDVFAKFNAPVPGADAFVYGELEMATIVGSTTFVRTGFIEPIDPQAERDDEEILSFGAAAKLGFTHLAGQGHERWGRVVSEIEWGYASGDADPTDGRTRRFTFEPNHNVGLVLFDQVLRWKTARAATNAQDPTLVNRPAPGLQFLSSRGAVFGASYLNPRVLVRPERWFDVKLGAVFAQTTADFVDPYHFGALGNVANYDGGDEKNHDLGVELDAGFDARLGMNGRTTVQLGAEGGVLFPGGAFEDALGVGLDTQYVANVKLGLQY